MNCLKVKFKNEDVMGMKPDILEKGENLIDNINNEVHAKQVRILHSQSYVRQFSLSH